MLGPFILLLVACRPEKSAFQSGSPERVEPKVVLWSNTDSTFRVLLEGNSITFLEVVGDAWVGLQSVKLEIDKHGWCQFEGGAVAVGSIDDNANELTIFVENFGLAGIDTITLGPGTEKVPVKTN